MTETLKPGTRCDCRDLRSAPDHCCYRGPFSDRCMNEAVRMVTVETQRNPRLSCVHVVPMCAACADWHESKAGAR